MLNSGFAAALGAGGWKSGMIRAQRYSPRREMQAGGRPLGWGHAAQPAAASTGRWGGLRGDDRTGKARNLDLEGKKADL